MISVRGLTKQYGDVRAVDDLTFDVSAGKVTGFLGPNGAGKSTTMRVLLGLDRATAGTATIGGRRYVDLGAPLLLVLPLLMGNLPFAWATTIAERLPGTGALFLIFGGGPVDTMTATTARVTMGAWALAALAAGGLRLLHTDANG